MVIAVEEGGSELREIGKTVVKGASKLGGVGMLTGGGDLKQVGHG
jgi:hypothetical protein